MPRANDASAIRFGVFEADLRSGELRKSGVKIRLRDQAFQVLTELLERPGEVVTREELRDRLWPDGTFVDFDHSLNAAVNSIRDVLGDSAASPRFVETVPRRGYRFIAPVEKLGESAPDPLSPLPRTQEASQSHTTDSATLRPNGEGENASAGPPNRRVSLRQAIWAVSLVVLIAAAVTSYRLLNKRPEAQVSPSPKKTYITSYPGMENQPSFSPDASQVAFAWGGDIYVKLIGVEPPRQITTGPLDEVNPVWSPDGRWIAFLRKLDDSSAEVLLTDPFGSRERKLAEVSALASFRFRHLAWSPDSKELVFVDNAPPAEIGSLFLMSIDTGEKRQLTAPAPGTYLDGSPAFSPDGRRLAFIRFPSGQPAGDLYVLDPSRDQSSEADLQRLTFDSDAVVAGWTPAGTHVLYTSEALRGGDLRRIAVSGNSEPELLAPLDSTGFLPAPAVSLDGRRVAYVETFHDTGVTRLEIPNGSGRPVSTMLIDSTRADMHAQYSPDGNRIAFRSQRSGSRECWTCESDGSNPVQLTSLSSCRNPQWAPDGRRIVFEHGTRGLEDIWVVDSEGGAARPLISGPSADIQANWSRDGEWVYFTSDRGGQFDVWKVRTDGGDPVQLTTTGGANPIESVDGEWLFFIEDHFPEWETGLWRVPVPGGQEEKVLESVFRSYVVVGKGIYFFSATHPSVEPSESHLYLQFYRFATREIEVIAQVKRGWKDQGFSVSPDGRSFLFTDSVRAGSDLVMLEDFQ